MPGSIDVLIMAAGLGRRFGSRKQFITAAGTTVAARACALFRGNSMVNNIILACPPEMDEEDFRARAGLTGGEVIVRGGAERAESVLNALNAASAEFVLVHDAARPLCPAGVIDRVIAAMFENGAAVPALKMTSTLKYLDPDNSLKELDRERVFAIQTPQGFRREQLLRAYENRKGSGYTDSSSVAAEAGIFPVLVEGSIRNMKITEPGDIKEIERMIQEAV